MALINQPFDGQLGNILIEKLKEEYNRLTIVVAFAKNSGVLRLKQELERFKSKGGSIHIFVGVDIQGTSYEALKNLLPLCDSLYVVHSEDSSAIFHSKVFLLEDDTKIWMAVGSNNLTGGGLWTNFESFQCQECLVNSHEFNASYVPFKELVDRYSDVDYGCSRRIQSEDDINKLLSGGYVVHEVKQRIKQKDEVEKRMQKEAALFARSRRANLPKVSASEPAEQKIQARHGESVQATNTISETNENERVWFEARKLTGGSRNILDLSKLGRIANGTATGSRYETNDYRYILGGVAFFDIDPTDTEVVKNITINYDGKDYSPCTIKFAPDNGSWRIQIKGQSTDGKTTIQSVEGRGWLVDKILVFEKIRTDYYALSVLTSATLVDCKLASYVVARNGSSPESKEYGFFNS